MCLVLDLRNLREIYHRPAAEIDFEWQAEYGDVVRYKAAFGEDRLLISDPKVLHYILQTSGYRFSKPSEANEMTRITVGNGILTADASDHKRHRKVLLPGFGGPQSRAFWPIFSGFAAQLTSKWKDMIVGSSNQEVVIDIPRWASRAMLDAIGEAAFDYQFGAMDNKETPLSAAYFTLLAKIYGSPSNIAIFMQNLWAYVPPLWLPTLSKFTPGMSLDHAKYTEKVATDVASKLIQTRMEELSHGEGNNDVVSLLVKANISENENTKLSDDELYSQMRTIMFAGHDTTASTLSWTLLELARHPEIQQRLREEIRAKKQDLSGRELGIRDLESMPYFQAVVKESLRYHPVAPSIPRQADRDDILPLWKPITLTTGEVLHELPIPKGQRFTLSLAGYNRNKDIFGEDAHVFNPDRWLSTLPKISVNVGVYQNLLTFGGGLRACIGFRFALIGFQAFLVELVSTYEFALTEEAKRIRRELHAVMVPFIEGQTDQEAHLPLKVSFALSGPDKSISGSIGSNYIM
ncbi:hypothetical protein EYR40_000308 [Pleurotus pulmonarius]|nr:hypothetical protein EYR40_000308 [Pleurotus pulmonarius]